MEDKAGGWGNLVKTEYLYSCIKEDCRNRKIIIYGYSERNKSVECFLRSKGITVSFYVDRSFEKQKIKRVYKPDVLEGLAAEYYVIVPMIEHQEIIDKLISYGYSEGDYAYLGDLELKIICDEKDHYEDNFGNVIIGEVDRSKIHFFGFNSKVIIPNDCIIDPDFIVKINDNSELKIGNGTKLRCHFIINDNCLFECGENCAFSKNGLIQMFDSKIKIGNGFTIERGYTIRALKKSYIEIGNDCMFSYNINVRTNDGHSIFDIPSGQNINSNDDECSNRNIRVGNHVWVGTNALIMYNTDIADGTVIGAMSFLKSKIPNNCIAAGIPAKVIRKNIAWSRNNCSDDIGECGEDYINMTKSSGYIKEERTSDGC